MWIACLLVMYLGTASSSSNKEDFYKQGYHPEFEFSDRVIKNNFFPSEDIKAVRDYMTLHPPQEVMPGWSLLMLNSILNKEYCQKSDAETNSIHHQSTSFIGVLDKIKSYAESIAKEPLAFFIVAFGKRGGNAVTSSQSYSKIGYLNFSLAPHADSCQLQSVDKNVFCLRKHTDLSAYHSMMDYTVLMYLNALKPNSGGEFLFLDLPMNATLTNDKTPADIHAIQDECINAKRSTITAECRYLEREATMTKVTPAPGKLVLFESGPNNTHAVLDHTTTEGRKILTIYLTRVSKIDMKNFPRNDMSAFPYSFQTCDTRLRAPTGSGSGTGSHSHHRHLGQRRSTLDAYQYLVY